MREILLPKLEASRKELLDLGMRNNLLNYKIPKVRGLNIVQEKSLPVYEILVKNGKAMTFQGRPGKYEKSTLPASSKKLQYVSPEELNLGIRKIVDGSIAIQPEAAIPMVAKLFGFARVTEDMRKFLSLAIDHAVEKEVVVKDGEFLKILN